MIMNWFAILCILIIGTFAGSTHDDDGTTIYQVLVENARGLNDEDADFAFFENDNDVYVQVWGYGSGDEKVLQTKTIDGSTRPEWNQIFVFRNTDDECGEYEYFKFKLYDDDTVLGQDVFGDDHLGDTLEFYVDDINVHILGNILVLIFCIWLFIPLYLFLNTSADNYIQLWCLSSNFLY